MGLLKLLGPDGSTVLWDFDDTSGAANPNTVKTNLEKTFTPGTITPDLRLQMLDAGANLMGKTFPPVEFAVPFTASATTDDNLWTGLGQLARYLLEAAPDHPLALEWTDQTAVKYLDLIGATSLGQLLGGPRGGIVSTRKSSLGPYTVTLLRQPWTRLASVTTSSDTVEDDPATGTPDGSRVYAVSYTGDLPTPAKVRAQMDAGSTVASLLVGHRARGSRPSSYFSDYLSDTGWFQCEATGRNWTVTLGTDTSAQTVATASPGSGSSVARVEGSGSSAGTMTRRVRATRTTGMDSLRGSWIPYLRCQAGSGTFPIYEVQLKWGPGTADPAQFSEAVVTLDWSNVGALGKFVEIPMGRIDIPPSVSLSGMAVEIWTRVTNGATNDLDLDLVDLWPADGLAKLLVPGASTTVTAGRDLTSPPDQISGDPAWIEAAQGGTFRQIDTSLEAVGLGPNTGTQYPAGRHRFVFDVELNSLGAATIERRVTNVTDNVEMASNGGFFEGRRNYLLEFDADGSDFYQAQVTATGLSGGLKITVWKVTHEFFPSVASGESIRTDPGPTRYAVDRLDSSGNLNGYLGIEGEVPVWLQPGDNHIKLRADEIPAVGYEELENKLDRDLTVSVTYDPRLAL